MSDYIAFTMPKYYTVKEVADLLKVSKMTVYRLIEAGDIEHLKVQRSFRISEDALREYIEENTKVVE